MGRTETESPRAPANVINIPRWCRVEKKERIIPPCRWWWDRTTLHGQCPLSRLVLFSRNPNFLADAPSRVGWPQIFNLHFSSAYRTAPPLPSLASINPPSSFLLQPTNSEYMYTVIRTCFAKREKMHSEMFTVLDGSSSFSFDSEFSIQEIAKSRLRRYRLTLR